ncbi:MAG TPA: DUF1326 domain-containing protein [Thermomicrobiales bacterium]|nr:DUF1326 domain-containing protein [Thermomicrobiales bacterium]
MVEQPSWRISGDYFENCSCEVVCPCTFSPLGPLSAQPSSADGSCEVPLAFHIESGTYGDVTLDGLNAVVALRSPGVMGEGNASVALYVDERANERQHEALTAIFSGAGGGPMGALAPLVGSVLGVTSAPIQYTIEGKRRAVEVPDVMRVAVTSMPGISGDGISADGAHPLFPTGLMMAVGDADSVYEDYGMRWDNSGKNGHHAAFVWSNS